MDGHEQSDIIKYCNEEFLPLMAKYKSCMVKWVENTNGGFECIEPQLGPGEKRVIPIFQDESSCHMGEYKSNVGLVCFLYLRFLSLYCAWEGCILMSKNS